MAAIALSGCAVAATLRAYDVAPSGIERSEEKLRVWLSRARPDSVAMPPRGSLPDDALVRVLYEGTFAYYNRKWKQAGEKFDEADRIAEARYTKSVTQNALAMLTNDRELDYEPGINERCLMHYYGALAFLGGGDLDGAAVEARKLAYLLQKYEGDMLARDRSVRTMLRWFAGAVFEAAGERNDALVSYRNARALEGEAVRGVDDERLPTDGLASDSGDVLVVVEQGYVAFPVPFDLAVPVYRHEAAYYGSGADRSRSAWMSGRVGWRLTAQLAALSGGGLYYHGMPGALPADDRWGTMTAGNPADVNIVYRPGNSYGYRYDPRWGWQPVRAVLPDKIIKLSIPVWRPPRRAARVEAVAGDAAGRAIAFGDLSEAEVADFERVRTWTYARAVLRTTIKAVAAEAAEEAAKKAARDKKKGEKDDKTAERWGRVFGFLSSAAGAILERADTRNWNLLPHAVNLVRLRLPAGKQEVTVRVGNGTELRIPDVTVRAGQLTFASTRVWGTEAEW